MRESSSDQTILLTGAYGHGNLGDDMLGMLTAKVLRDAGLDVLVAAGKPSDVGAELSQSRRSLMKILGSKTTVLLGGGGLFNDAWGTDYSRYFASLALSARLRGGAAKAVGIGVEPPRRLVGRAALILGCQSLVPFGVRDAQSATTLERFRARRVFRGGDLGWLAAHDVSPRVSLAPGLVSVTVAGETAAAADARLRLLAGSLSALLRAGRVERVRGVVMQRSEHRALHDDHTLLVRLSQMLSHPIEIVTPENPHDAALMLAEGGVSLGFRLHGLLLAYLGGAQVVALSRSEKVSATFSDLPGAVVIDEQVATADTIFAAVVDLQGPPDPTRDRSEVLRRYEGAKSDLLKVVRSE
jgi:polysaccharide pyruvyl transferase WcaK-like protein